MKAGNAKWAALALSAGLLAGCSVLGPYPEQPPILTGGSVEHSLIRIKPVRDLDELQPKCMNRDPRFVMYACAYPSIDPANPKQSVCTIFVFMPESRDDTTKVALLGHEAWHCFGAVHLDVRMAAASYR